MAIRVSSCLVVRTLLASFPVLALVSCGGSSAGLEGAEPLKATLDVVHQGRLVDVYGLRDVGGIRAVDLYQTDVLIGPDIEDQRGSESSVRDDEILYDFISTNPENLQPRLLITREIGSAEFLAAFNKLDDLARDLAPAQFGRDTGLASYSVVPRNAALRLTFSRDLFARAEEAANFFVARDENGRALRVRNTEAVQLLRIKGDPNDNQPAGDFEVIPSRIVVRKNVVIVDPVLLGNEGLQFGSGNVASGMPASPDQSGANVRLAVALQGPLRIPGIADNPITDLSGANNSGDRSIIRDFRSGNVNDNSSDLSRGFVRDPLPLRLVGEMRMYLERVEDGEAAGTKVLTLFKNGVRQEIDASDVVRLFVLGASQPEAVVEVLADPEEDRGRPAVQHVRVLVRTVVAGNKDVLQGLDPRSQPGYPNEPGPGELEKWLRQNAPVAVLVAEFSHASGDDLAWFVPFDPTPIQDAGSIAPPNQDVSPFAGVILRFNKPVDMDTVGGVDSMFFATRDVITKAAIEQFLTDASMATSLAEDPAFQAKFRTPHLVYSRVFDGNGSQTEIRLQPTMGFYLDDVMRAAVNQDRAAAVPLSQWRYNYYFHLVRGSEAVRDLSGNELDLQVLDSSVQALVMPFSLDTRMLGGDRPRFANNLVIYTVRRFADPDEDERWSLYLPNQRPPANGSQTVFSFCRDDMFGGVTYLASGQLQARGTSRRTAVVDNLNQLPPPPQSSPQRWCPLTVNGANQVINATGAVRFGQPLQNPLNPFGARVQTVWREVDMSLSRTDPDHMNLDVERMYWAPFAGGAITFDEFDRVSLFLGHSEYRPEPCINGVMAVASMPLSGLKRVFSRNYAFNTDGNQQIEFQPLPHPAYVDQVLTINGSQAITEPNQVNRFLPLPTFADATKRGFDDPLFVYRDETVEVQGGVNELLPNQMNPYPYILSPFMAGQGFCVTIAGNNVTFNRGAWYNGINLDLVTGAREDITGGLVGPIALPLLADFWTYPDSANLPAGNPFRAAGSNGWQISLGTTVAPPRPDFRAYSAGFRGTGGSPTLVGPSESPGKWALASGGFTPQGMPVQATDNTIYWIMVDYLARTTVATNGFVDILNPHRMPATGSPDPRLGPYTPPGNSLPEYAFDFEPPLSTLPAGTSVVPEFRGAGAVDTLGPGFPWPETRTITGANPPTPANFPLDPHKAADAWIRHWDTRPLGSQPRRSWTHLYNRNVTAYTEDPNDLSDTAFTNKFGGPNEVFSAQNVRYFNWRFILRNNVDATPPVSPKIDTFAVSYRFVQR